MPNAEEVAWCISAKAQKKIQQASVMLNDGKTFAYACRYPVQDGDLAIIGNQYPSYSAASADPMATTGQMGIASDVLPSLIIKKDHAAEIDYVFTKQATKKMITDCVKYLDMPGDENTLQYGKEIDTIYPISFLVRKLLAAASVLAFPALANAASIQKAKDYIAKPQIIDEQMSCLRMAAPELVQIDLSDIHVDIDKKNQNEWEAFPANEIIKVKVTPNGSVRYSKGYRKNPGILSEINEYVNKYSYIGAISIMVRGGLVNILKAFLTANPPIKGFSRELLEAVGNNGNMEAHKILNDYIA